MKRSLMLLALGLFFGVVVQSNEAHAQQAWNSVTLTWTTPGDDSLSGTASQFDIRYSTSPITAANFSAATRFTSGVPIPAASGTAQSVLVTGLAPATTYYFAVKTGDEVPNWANISNVVSKTLATAPDVVRPAALAMSATALSDTSVTLAWTATGDDSLTGTATSYDIRYSTSPITAANFSAATAVSGAPAPAVAGTAQTMVVHTLSRQVTYYFAAKVSDEAGNTSALSNVPSATTPDTKAPASITNLAVNLIELQFLSSALLRGAGR